MFALEPRLAMQRALKQIIFVCKAVVVHVRMQVGWFNIIHCHFVRYEWRRLAGAAAEACQAGVAPRPANRSLLPPDSAL